MAGLAKKQLTGAFQKTVIAGMTTFMLLGTGAVKANPADEAQRKQRQAIEQQHRNDLKKSQEKLQGEKAGFKKTSAAQFEAAYLKVAFTAANASDRNSYAAQVKQIASVEANGIESAEKTAAQQASLADRNKKESLKALTPRKMA